ncbi:hypothetical protein JYB62_03670 [Algoriphagus lutimaris]|nr:hypothetical protein [Algoriphagus lutimaris]
MLILLITGGILFLTLSNGPTPTLQTINSNNESPTLVSGNGQFVDGKDVETGLVKGDGFELVKANCTSCHSSALILQNRFTREGWKVKIEWMQETQGLWDLGNNESLILDYLAANYAPEAYVGRRAPLKDIEWYELKE